MDLNELRKLVRLMERAELCELEIDDANAGLRVHLKRGMDASGGDSVVQPVVQPMVQMMPGAAPGPGLADTQFTPAAAAGEAAPLPPGTETFVSPMVGTFYRAASPDADPFVEVGTQVGEDSTICIVEAMKVMNEIKSEMRGTIVEVLAENGEPIEFGQSLFLIKKG